MPARTAPSAAKTTRHHRACRGSCCGPGSATRVLGPLSADTLFHEDARKTYDAALCMYHDQALIPIKTLAFWTGVNVTLGLPIVRTSPDHGTALDIAGRGIANEKSMIAAIEMAADIAGKRGPVSEGPSPSAGIDGLPPLREVIARHGLAAKKGLGQNFILDLNLTRRIAREAGIDGETVYEVGPGPGGLTRALLAEGAKRVIAVERDFRCLPALGEISARADRRASSTVVEADALAAGRDARFWPHAEKRPVAVVANLPFNVGTALLVKWLTDEDWPPWWSSLTLMFQKEVAERIVAPSGRRCLWAAVGHCSMAD